MHIIRTVVFSFFLLGCVTREPSVDEINQKIILLKNQVLNLNIKVSKYEAKDLAINSIGYSYKLAKKYKTVSSPWIQNTLVNIGLKQRGLCHEWAEDLLKHLVQKDYKTLDFHTIGANIGYMNEHNALSVSARGEGVENSILLDAWRNPGNLYFKKIKEDKKYEWKERRGLYGILPLKSGK